MSGKLSKLYKSKTIINFVNFFPEAIFPSEKKLFLNRDSNYNFILKVNVHFPRNDDS